MTLNEYAEAVHETAIEKGWWDKPRRIPEILCLIHSEISEALECYRISRMETYLAEGSQEPKGFPIELADILIRIFDLVAHLDIDLDEAVQTKAGYNKTRSYRHGGKVV